MLTIMVSCAFPPNNQTFVNTKQWGWRRWNRTFINSIIVTVRSNIDIWSQHCLQRAFQDDYMLHDLMLLRRKRSLFFIVIFLGCVLFYINYEVIQAEVHSFLQYHTPTKVMPSPQWRKVTRAFKNFEMSSLPRNDNDTLMSGCSLPKVCYFSELLNQFNC